MSWRIYPVDNLELSVRVANCLRYEGITTLEQLVQVEAAALLRVPNFGKVSLQEIEFTLKRLGLRLGMNEAAMRERDEVGQLSGNRQAIANLSLQELTELADGEARQTAAVCERLLRRIKFLHDISAELARRLNFNHSDIGRGETS